MLHFITKKWEKQIHGNLLIISVLLLNLLQEGTSAFDLCVCSYDSVTCTD